MPVLADNPSAVPVKVKVTLPITEQDWCEEIIMLAELRSGRVLPYFWKTAGNYSPIYEDWQSCLHPAEEFQGREWYLYAVVKNPGAFNLKYVFPYGEYLERLDSEARQGLARAD